MTGTSRWLTVLSVPPTSAHDYILFADIVYTWSGTWAILWTRGGEFVDLTMAAPSAPSLEDTLKFLGGPTDEHKCVSNSFIPAGSEHGCLSVPDPGVCMLCSTPGFSPRARSQIQNRPHAVHR